MMGSEFLLLAIAALVSAAGIYMLRRWLERRQIMDIPNERSSHQRPTPRGGGLLIVVVTLLGLLLYNLAAPVFDGLELLVYTAAAVVLAIIGWLDDVRSVSTRLRLAVQSLCALLVAIVIGFSTVVLVPVFGLVFVGWLGLLFTLIWIVGLTNAYNFMDGIDGLAGGQAVIAGIGWMILGALSQQTAIIVTGALVAGSSLGFLWHNWPPAKLFMGDVGSTFLGFTFAVLTIIASRSDDRLLVCGVLLLWPFLFDVVVTRVRRLLRGENLLVAHREHFYQRLVIAGMSHRAVTLLYLLLAALGVVLALAWYADPAASGLTILVILVVLSAAVASFTRSREAKRQALAAPPQ